jgi:hypothetical protein
MPVYYSVNGSNPLPVPTTGMFGYMGKQTTATSKDDAILKAKSAKINVPPGTDIWGANIQNNSFVVQYQNGGKRRKSRSCRTKRRKSGGKKTRRSRK